ASARPDGSAAARRRQPPRGAPRGHPILRATRRTRIIGRRTWGAPQSRGREGPPQVARRRRTTASAPRRRTTMPRPHARILGTRNNHNSPAHYEQLAGLLVGPAGLSVTVRDDYPAQTEASLAGFDLLVLWAADARPPLPQAATDAVFATVRRGTPLLGIHGAAFNMGKAAGGPEAGGTAYQSPHLPVQAFDVHVDDADHPVTAGVEDFRIEDEPYRLDVVGEGVRVLC